MQRAKWPYHTLQEIRSVNKVILSNKVNYWTGKEGKKFENEFADYIKTKYAIAVSNGTVALELALHALNIKKGDEILVTPRSYIASASCVVSKGAIPVFVDVDLNSQNISPNFIEEKITKKTKAIICVHLAGWPCEMDEIMSISNANDLFVIEDCAQAHGAKYKGTSVGSIGHIGCWSFCQDKIMSTGGEGGMVTTNDKSLWKKMWEYKDHGKSYEAVYEREHAEGFRWLHESFGTNWRMTEMQGAIGRIQLRRMPEWTKLRNRNADILSEAFFQFVGEHGSLRIPQLKFDQECVHAFYKYYVFVKDEALKECWDRDRIIAEINSEGVPCIHGSCSEIYLEKAFDDTNFRPDKRLPYAKELGETSMVFLVHPTLSEKEMRNMAKIATSIIDMATES